MRDDMMERKGGKSENCFFFFRFSWIGREEKKIWDFGGFWEFHFCFVVSWSCSIPLICMCR